MTIFGYGQGLVMAPLVERRAFHGEAGERRFGAGCNGTTAQIANGAGVAAIGTYFLRSK